MDRESQGRSCGELTSHRIIICALVLLAAFAIHSGDLVATPCVAFSQGIEDMVMLVKPDVKGIVDNLEARLKV